jgi:O-acetyl-ADP-ribose deacetylase (regulator of RNase III)
MPVTVFGGSLFDSKAQTLVCTVNTVGVMGAGVAKVFKERWPEMFQAYKRACRDDYFRKHSTWLFKVSDDLQILCMVTKGHWRYPSKPEWVEASLQEMARRYEDYGITSLALPPPGCGNGGLLWWEEVWPLVERHLDPLPISVNVYIPEDWLR